MRSSGDAFLGVSSVKDPHLARVKVVKLLEEDFVNERSVRGDERELGALLDAVRLAVHLQTFRVRLIQKSGAHLAPLSVL